MKLSTLLLFAFLSTALFAQHENDLWYFGNNAGLDFSSGSPVPISGGQTSVYEGTAVACDDTTGSLLFYTDGMTVWNTNHQQMPNGFGLNGHTSSTQSAIIVPNPAGTLYYIFTTGSAVGFNGGYAGLCVSTVDMSLNSGLGDVTVKNQVLLTQSTEKLVAVRNDFCEGYWVITHGWNSDAFYAYAVTNAGIASPVISNTGSVHQDVGSGNNSEAIGYMRISNDGTKLALNTFINMNTVELFDFDVYTGFVSNGAVIDTYPVSINNGPYGLCFSPDGTRLYVSNNSLTTSNALYQYDLTLSSPTAIGASQTLIASTTTNGLRYSALQLGPNGKIYMTKYTSNTIDVINTPNALGAACGYVSGAITITSGSPSYGLPNFTVLPACGKFMGTPATAQPVAAIRLFPNPTDGKMTVSVTGFDIAAGAELLIYDVSGKVVYSKMLTAATTEINTGFLSNGIYQCSILGKGQFIGSGRLVIAK
jgi:hypothetical protein